MTTVTIQPDATAGLDTYINGGSTASNYGVATELRTAGPASVKKILIKFDLSSIPSTAIITNAQLNLNCSTNNAAQNVTLHRALVAWFEGNGNASLGSVAGSTWAQKDDFGNVNWASSTAGGLAGTDYGSSPISTTLVNTTGFIQWSLTAEVQSMVNGSVTNHGWWLLQASGSDNIYRSSDYATAADRPKLVIDYVDDHISGAIAGTSTVTGNLSYEFSSGAAIQPGPVTGVDTEIDNNSPTFNYGIRSDFHVGYTTGPEYRTLIKFDLSAVPAGATITAATLSLYCYNRDAVNTTTVDARRMLVQWYEGDKATGSPPSAGVDGSVWNYRNYNGSVTWGTAGGLSGTDFNASVSGSVAVLNPSTWYDIDLTADVQNMVSGAVSNYGWMLKAAAFVSNNRKYFYSSDEVTNITLRPKLTLTYETRLVGSSGGTSTVTGEIEAIGYMEGSSAGTSLAEAAIKNQFFSVGASAGVASVSGTMFAPGYIQGSGFGDSTSVADIKASYHSIGTAAGTSTHVAHLKGRFRLQGLATGVGSLTAVPSFEGQMRGLSTGTSLAVAVGYARATGKATLLGCNPVPLFYLTDGTLKPNGQQNILNFLSERNGYLLRNYRPQIPQYKEGGRFSNSSQSQGRRLRFRVFDNAIDVLELAVKATSQDDLIQFQQDLIEFQEAAADYWVSDYTLLPIYLVGRAARETYTRYAVVHMISVPELENPFSQPFFSNQGATFEALTIRIEHGMWMSTPPGFFDCVEISSQREWTVSGWQ